MLRYIVGVLVAVFAAAILTACGGSSGKTEESGITIQSAATPSSEPAVEAIVPTLSPSPTAVAIPQPEKVVAGDSVSIAKIKVDAPLILLPVTQGGVMPAPSKPNDVGYYSFPSDLGVGGKIGQPGNAVFSGHVDLVVGGRPQQAVFWDLDRLSQGDEIRFTVEGKTYKYAVTSSRLEPSTPPPGDDFYWNRLIAATEAETITLITCGGSFDPKTREYDKRRVVTAVRVP